MSSSGGWRVVASAALTRALTSRMADPRHAIKREKERVPDAALLREHLPASGRQPVVAPAALASAFDPAAFDEALVFEPIQGRIERRGVERDGAAGSFLNQPADVVPVPLPLVEQREDQHLRAPSLQFALQHRRAHMWRDYISRPAASSRPLLAGPARPRLWAPPGPTASPRSSGTRCSAPFRRRPPGRTAARPRRRPCRGLPTRRPTR